MRSRRHLPTPCAIRTGPVQIYRGVVQGVDAPRSVCDVIAETVSGQRHYSEVSILSTFISSDGGGFFAMPETGSVVWLCVPSSDGVPFIMASAAQPAQNDEGDPEEDPGSRRMNRTVPGEGDIVLSGGADGGFVILRKGGTLEVGSNQMCWSAYVPLEHLIRTFCRSYRLRTGGGHLKFDTRHGGDESFPVELDLQVKEFADDASPIFQLSAGRIADEDDQRCTSGVAGEIVARLLINNRVKVYLDKSGNMDMSFHGSVVQNIEGTHLQRSKSYFHRVRNLYKGSYGTRAQEVSGADELRVGGDRLVEINGGLSETVTGTVTRRTGALAEEIKGRVERIVKGIHKESITGASEKVIGGSKTEAIGGNLEQSVSGSWRVSVQNNEAETGDVFSAEWVNDLGVVQASVAFSALGSVKLSTVAGEQVTVTALGQVLLGGPDATEFFIKGTQWNTLFTALVSWLDTHVHPTAAPGPPSPPVVPSTPVLAPYRANCVSTTIFGK